MWLVIADTSPINYLILIGHIDLLPRLFERVALPSAVQAELSDSDAPPEVQRWIANPPAWLEVHQTSGPLHESGLDEGEAAAIALAEILRADMLLIDERAAFRIAQRKGLRVTGTLWDCSISRRSGAWSISPKQSAPSKGLVSGGRKHCWKRFLPNTNESSNPNISNIPDLRCLSIVPTFTVPPLDLSARAL